MLTPHEMVTQKVESSGSQTNHSFRFVCCFRGILFEVGCQGNDRNTPQNGGHDKVRPPTRKDTPDGWLSAENHFSGKKLGIKPIQTTGTQPFRTKRDIRTWAGSGAESPAPPRSRGAMRPQASAPSAGSGRPARSQRRLKGCPWDATQQWA